MIDNTSSKTKITTTASILLVSQLALPANGNRTGLIIFNNSANSVYVAFGLIANSATYMSIIIPTFAQFVMTDFAYTGPIAAIRNAGSGVLFITEFLPY